MNGIRVFGPNIGRAGLISFLLDGVHAHDVVTVPYAGGRPTILVRDAFSPDWTR